MYDNYKLIANDLQLVVDGVGLLSVEYLQMICKNERSIRHL